MKKILITGSEGYLGSFLTKFFKKNNFQVYGFDLHNEPLSDSYIYHRIDITNYDDLQIYDNIQFDYIIHCAALLAFEKNKKKIQSVNIDGSRNLIKYFTKNRNKPKVVFLSTASIFSDNYEIPVHENAKPNIVDEYGSSKKICEQLFINSELDYIIIRCPIIISDTRSGVLGIAYDLIKLNKKLPLLNSGKNHFDIIEINDLAHAINLSLNKANREIYNIGSGEDISFFEVFDYLIKNSNSKSKILFLPKIDLSLIFKLLFKINLSPISSYHLSMLNNNFRFDITKIKKIGWLPKSNPKKVFLESYNNYLRSDFTFSRSKNSKRHKLKLIKLIYFLL